MTTGLAKRPKIIKSARPRIVKRVATQKAKFIHHLRENPMKFFNGCGWDAWSKQAEIVNSVFRHERTAVPASYGVGKTYIAAKIALTFLQLYRPSKVITTAPTFRQVKDLLWSELRSSHRKSKRRLLGTPLQTKLELEEDWFCVGFSTRDDDVEKFTGYHSPNLLLIFDQACGISRNLWEAAEGLMTSHNVHWLAISNTTDEQSEMATVCLPDRKSDFGKWNVIPINAFDSPNVKAGKNIIPGIISHDWVNKRKEVWDEEDPLWQIFVLAQFVEADALVAITSNMIRDAFKVKKGIDKNDIAVGIDVADKGRDKTVWTSRAGAKMLGIEAVSGHRPMKVVQETVDLLNKIAKRFRVNAKEDIEINIDAIGVGAGIANRLDELGYMINEINVGESAYDKSQFMNRKAEMLWNTRDNMEMQELSLTPLFSTKDIYIQYLKEEMPMRYRFTSTNKIQAEIKEMVKKRIKRSPDFFDSFELCFMDFGDGATGIDLTSMGTENRKKPSSEGENIADDLNSYFPDDEDDESDTDEEMEIMERLFGSTTDIPEEDWEDID